MNQQGIGTYLAQGAAANMIAINLFAIGVIICYPRVDDRTAWLLALPIYTALLGFPGVLMGASIWLAGFLRKRKLNFFERVIAGILVPALLAAMLGLAFDFIRQPLALLGVGLVFLPGTLPAALLSGSRFNPLRTTILGSDWSFCRHNLGFWLSFVPAMLLRIISVWGLIEIMIDLAGLRDPRRVYWALDDRFLFAIVGLLYFAVTAMASFRYPGNALIIAAAVLGNAPLVIWAADPTHTLDTTEGLLGIACCVLVLLWAPMVMGRLMTGHIARPRPLRVLPVTILEIRMRHAFNWW